ncbi:pentapeptide repeat-containing protein [Micromonospora echinospora]|uniref:pentapeptide repeat-containing protein n=1 Tax=Micromonospora echinospora TaxID=1877 RepID=UPI00379F9F38
MPVRTRGSAQPAARFRDRVARPRPRADAAPVRLDLGTVEVKPDPWQRWIATGQVVSVLVLAVGLYLTYRANQETSSANREQHRLTAEGQITERFATAIEQLGEPGKDKIDVRLGGIYSLERIMRDSTVDQPTIVDVLSAFVRVHAPTPTTGRDRFDPKRVPPVDIQAALSVLGQRDPAHDRAGQRLDLHGADLRGADLRAARLGGADLSAAFLTGARLHDADLENAKLTDAVLVGASLNGANLNLADLSGADLRTAQLGPSYRPDLPDGPRLSLTRLTGVNLRGADLRGSDLYGADLRGAYLRGRTQLEGERTECRHALCPNDAELRDADLRGAVLTCVSRDHTTSLPKGVNPQIQFKSEPWCR